MRCLIVKLAVSKTSIVVLLLVSSYSDSETTMAEVISAMRLRVGERAGGPMGGRANGRAGERAGEDGR